MRLSAQILLCLIWAPAMLSGCAPNVDSNSEELRDPLVERALNDLLMIDPDLALLNEANAALTIGFDSSIPPLHISSQQATNVRKQTHNLLIDGGKVLKLPRPQDREQWPDLTGALTAGERLARLPFGRACAAAELEYSALWAARLPPFAQIAPEGAVMEAAGHMGEECDVRIVQYLTLLSPKQAIRYHYNIAERLELEPRYFTGADDVILGAVDNARLVVHARARGQGLTEIDVITYVGGPQRLFRKSH